MTKLMKVCLGNEPPIGPEKCASTETLDIFVLRCGLVFKRNLYRTVQLLTKSTDEIL